MTDTCQHCGYFVVYEIPKAPEKPRWVHTPYAPAKPTRPLCDDAQPTQG